jgi:hypothetical protein
VAAAALAAVVVVAGLGGCGRRADDAPRDGLAPDTARFTYDSRRAEVPLAACGQEGDVVLLAGTEGAIVVQAVADVGDGGVERSGVTADLGDGVILGAFGADNAEGPAGEITDVRIEGDRVIIEGRWTQFDSELNPQPLPPDQLVDGRLVARCPETGERTD